MDTNLLVGGETKGNERQQALAYVLSGVVLLLIIIVLTLLFLSNNNPKDSNASSVTLLPENTCPSELTEFSGRVSAIYNGMRVEMSKEVYDWVLANCGLEVGVSDNSVPVLYNLGINLEGRYDVMTGRAGAFIFDKDSLASNAPTNKIFFEFGAVLSTTDGEKTFPEIIYNQVDSDTDVIAIARGKVVELGSQEASNDFVVSVLYNDRWVVNYDHLRDVQVEMGAEIEAGHILGKVSLNRDGITGFTEISLKEVSAEGLATFHCPTKFLDSSVKANLETRLTELMADWESYMGDTNIYSQETQFSPGCVVESFSE